MSEKHWGLADKIAAALSELEDDWDSYGALRPHPQAINRAVRFARLLESPPVVCPTVNGNISFEWDDCEIEIGSDANEDGVFLFLRNPDAQRGTKDE